MTCVHHLHLLWCLLQRCHGLESASDRHGYLLVWCRIVVEMLSKVICAGVRLVITVIVGLRLLGRGIWTVITSHRGCRSSTVARSRSRPPKLFIGSSDQQSTILRMVDYIIKLGGSLQIRFTFLRYRIVIMILIISDML